MADPFTTFESWKLRTISIELECVTTGGPTGVSLMHELTAPCFGFFAVYPVRRLIAGLPPGHTPDLKGHAPSAYSVALIGQARPIGYAPTEAAGRQVAEAAMAYDLDCWQFSTSTPPARLANCHAKILAFVREMHAAGLLCMSALGLPGEPAPEREVA